MEFGKNFSVTVKTETFEITRKSINATDIVVTGPSIQEYTGKPVEPKITVTYKSKVLDQSGTYQLVQGTDYTITYSNNINTGKAKATLTGKGNFSGTYEHPFTIIRKSGASSSSTSTSASTSASSSSNRATSGASGSGSETTAGRESGKGEDNPENKPVGLLKLSDIDYGTILFGADGLPRPFDQFEEELEPETEEEISDIIEDADDTLSVRGDVGIELSPEIEGVQLMLTIVPDPLKDTDTGDPVLLEAHSASSLRKCTCA